VAGLALAAALLLALAASAAQPARAQDVESELEAQRAPGRSSRRSGRREEAAAWAAKSSVLQGCDGSSEIGLTRELVTTLEDEIEERSRQIESTTEEPRAQDELAVKRRSGPRLRTI
jgi:hypothetical protein